MIGRKSGLRSVRRGRVQRGRRYGYANCTDGYSLPKKRKGRGETNRGRPLDRH